MISQHFDRSKLTRTAQPLLLYADQYDDLYAISRNTFFSVID
jgi:hypothetical protein